MLKCLDFSPGTLEVEPIKMGIKSCVMNKIKPTCAATVCDLVGNNFVTQAVLKPAFANPKAALRPAPPAPTTTQS